ncbi:hypothetical protein CTAYLR_002660 [Chrysophaeum taylorii]|uniref:Fibronectin type-III domain-containing protein n=1 Tax=Chrysophaeum taylorii TaxID=2483200 RepID=A0AAD7UC79_9STRA|nr:hypothetical protein CTAYLR_002660 [Chrysophaeum taylorii]
MTQREDEASAVEDAGGERDGASTEDIEEEQRKAQGLVVARDEASTEDIEEEQRRAQGLVVARDEASTEDGAAAIVEKEEEQEELALAKHVEGLVVEEVTSTSVRLAWERPKTSYRVDGARVGLRRCLDKNKTFETLVTHTRDGDATSYVVVNLVPATEYVFQVVSLHDARKDGSAPRPMIIDGTKLTSVPTRTAKALYMRAWFFENLEEIERQWAIYFGRSSDPRSTADATKLLGALSSAELLRAQALSISQTLASRKPSCLSGRQCMVLKVPGGVEGGCCVDVAVASARKYRAEVYVFHDVGEMTGNGVVMGVWDYEAQYEASMHATLARCWEKLEVEFVGGSLGRAKLSIQCSAGYAGDVLIDSCCVFMLGRDRLGENAEALEKAAADPRANRSGVLRVDLVEAVNLPRFAYGKPPSLPEAATLDEPGGGDDHSNAFAKELLEIQRRRPASRGEGRHPAQLRFVARWGDKQIADPALPLSAVGNKKDGNVKDDFYDPSRPCAWSGARYTLQVRPDEARDDDIEAALSKRFELELQDATVRGRLAAKRRREFQSAIDARNQQQASSSCSSRHHRLESDDDDDDDGGPVLAAWRGTAGGSDEVVAAVGPVALLARSPSQSLKATKLHGMSRSLRHLSRSSKKLVANAKKKADATDEGAPVARLRLSLRELLAAPAYRTWYRLEGDEGLTQTCVALVVRSWDPDDDENDENDEPDEPDDEPIRRLASALATTRGGEEDQQKVKIFGKLLRKLGASSSALASKAGASRRANDENKSAIGGTARAIAGRMMAGVDRKDPVEAQAQVDPRELLVRKTEMFRRGILEECAASLHEPSTATSAAALLVAMVNFPERMVAASADVARCRAALQRAARSTGVLTWVEEATDAYSPGIHAAGASASDDAGDVADASAAVPPLAGRQKALAAAIAAAGAPSSPPSIAAASAVLACVCGSRRVLLDVLERRPSLFPVLARGALDGVHAAASCLENLNLAPAFSPKLADLYKRYRVLVPTNDARFWRCPTLENDLQGGTEDVRALCRGARRRARSAERHREATGAFPRRVRVLARPFAPATPLSGDAADFARLTIAGGPAYPRDDADRDDHDLVAVAFPRVADKQLKVKEPEPDRRILTPQQQKPGTPLRAPTPEERRQIALRRKREANVEERPLPPQQAATDDEEEEVPRVVVHTIDTGTTQLQIIGEVDDDDASIAPPALTSCSSDNSS